MSTAWFNCQAGVAGDMTLAALVDAGADPDHIARSLGGLGVEGWAMHFERVQRCGVGATWANVVVHDEHGSHDHGSHDHTAHRPVREIHRLIDAADLPEQVRVTARAVFDRLADAEGAIHGVDPDDVELHEVGAVDSIVDVVGVCAALDSLGITDVRCSPIAVGTGSVRSAHGVLPNPAPATVAILASVGAPLIGLDTTLEVTTPTGAALMATLATGFGALPSMKPVAVGYGAGTADTAGRANVVQVVIGDGAGVAADTGSEQGTDVLLLEVNVDDVTGEVLAHAVAELLEAGAHDAWITPIVMKKGRPAHMLSVLCDPSGATTLRSLLLRETGSLGVRASMHQRWPQRREITSVDIDGHPVGIKRSGERTKVEFDDAAAAARELDLPVRIVIERAAAQADQPR